MKFSKSQNDAGGRLRNGIFKEFFKDGTLSCAGVKELREDQRVESNHLRSVGSKGLGMIIQRQDDGVLGNGIVKLER